MRDAAGEASDGFHLLRLLILLLEVTALGDVQGNPDAAHWRAALVEVHAARAGQPPHAAVGPDRPVLDREIVANRPGVIERFDHRRAVLGMNALDERLEGSPERAGLQAVLGFECRGPSEDPRRVVHVPDADLGALERKPHALFRCAHRFDRLMPLGDVSARAECADDPSVVVTQHRVAPFDQPLFTRQRDDGVLDERKVAALKRAQPLPAVLSQSARKTGLDPVASD